MGNLYSSESYDLAKYFVEDKPWTPRMTPKIREELTVELARHVQQSVEDWFENKGKTGWIVDDSETVPFHPSDSGPINGG